MRTVEVAEFCEEKVRRLGAALAVSMRTVEVAEFCERPEAVLTVPSPVVVVADGTPIRVYVPARRGCAVGGDAVA